MPPPHTANCFLATALRRPAADRPAAATVGVRFRGHRTALPVVAGLLWAIAGGLASGETSGPAAAPAAETFAQLAPILQRSCGACHGAEKAESELRIDRLDPDLVNGVDHARWRKVFDRLSSGDMPPEDATPLPEADRERLKQWLVRELKRGELARNPPAHFRRLTRLEYERTMQDLLGLPLEFGKRLPEDGRAKSGFRNDGDTLRMSPLQFELFSQIAEEALGQVIVEGPPPVAHRYRFTPVDRPRDNLEVTVLPRPDGQPCETFAYVTGSTAKGPAVAFRIWNMHDHRHAMQWIQSMGLKNRPAAAQPAAGGGKNDAAATENQSASPTPQTPAVEPNPYHMLGPSAIARNIEASNAAPRGLVVGLERAFREDALIRVRVSRLPEAEGGGDPARPPWLALAIGTTNFKGVVLKPVGQPIIIDHDDFRVHEFRVRMENFPSPGTDASADARVLQFNATVLAAWNAAPAIRNVSPSLLRIDWMELETPFIEQWPPANHRAIVPVDGGSMEEAARARQVIERFATRAFRRPLEAAELDRLCGLWKTARADASSFEASLRETLAVVLASPQFLALPATRGGAVSGGATPAAAAGSAGPQRVDDFQLAARLSYFLWSTTPDDRLMEAARSGQLREPDGLAEQVRRMLADPRSWGFFDQFTEQWLELDRLQRVVFDRRLGFSEELAADMRQETVHFVAALVRENRSLFQLVDSPDTFLNQALAGHYGIEGVAGPEFRRVALAPQHRRGGVLAHAAVLAGTSDGVEGHPIKRGMWLVKNLLDEPPPPPPPNVPEIDRKDDKNEGLTMAQMLAVHRESKACAGCHRQIDPWGLAFEEYDAVGRWRARPRQKNPADALVELPTGAKIDSLGQLKAELIRSKPDVIRRAVSRKVLAYALGRTLNIADVEAADALADRLRDRGDGLGDLVVMIVQSEVFQAR